MTKDEFWTITRNLTSQERAAYFNKLSEKGQGEFWESLKDEVKGAWRGQRHE